MNRLFYGKLAVGNLKKNARLYLPYVLAAIGTCAMYYIMGAISSDEGIYKMPGSQILGSTMGLGCGVIAVFAVIFLFYTNSFLMKRRKKEFGLFHILGMAKRHIARMMFWEMAIVAGVSIGIGTVIGIVLNKLAILVLVRLLGFEAPFGFHVSWASIASVAILFACIFTATLIYNLFQVQKASPIELLRSSNQGEREPKTRWLMAVLGLLSLGAGYGIAIVVENPMGVLLLFFLAVILVIIGTYCLFTAGSIAVLKILRKNKGYYYKTRHFTSVSGMIYRMKQNAVGLSNICILSTMVLVMISGTLSLYAGIDDTMCMRYPKEIRIRGTQIPESDKMFLQDTAKQAAADMGLEIEYMSYYSELSVFAFKLGDEFYFNPGDNGTASEGEWCECVFLTMDDYVRLGGARQELKEDEVLAYTESGERGDEQYRIKDRTFRIKEQLAEMELDDMDTELIYNVYFVVVKDDAVLNDLQNLIAGSRADDVEYLLSVDVSKEAEDEIAYADHVRELLEPYNGSAPEGRTVLVASRAGEREEQLVFTGGFLFLGIFLGLVFLMATTLIIYYKQISEGYEDKERFVIMQKVGMSKREVRASIRSQVLKVFFLPLLMACIHLAAAFPMMCRLLLMFNMANVALFAACVFATVGLFTVIYIIVYGITARSYYKIVENE